MTFNFEERLAFFSNKIHEETEEYNKAYHKEKSRQQYLKNPELCKARAKQWRLDHPEEMKKALKKYRDKHNMTLYNRLYRRKHAAKFNLKRQMLSGKLPKEPTICKHCGLQMGASKAAKNQHNFEYHSY